MHRHPEKVSEQVYRIYILSGFGFVYTILQKVGM